MHHHQAQFAQLNNLEEDPAQFQNNFESGYNCASQKFALLHLLNYLIKVKDSVNYNQDHQTSGITIDQLKNIRQQDSCLQVSQEMAHQIDQRRQQKVEQGNDSPELDQDDLLLVAGRTFKGDLTYIITLFLCDSLVRVAFSVMVFLLLKEVSHHNYNIGYVYAGILILLWYASQTLKKNAIAETLMMNSKFKAGMLMLIYSKVIGMTSYTIKRYELSKITHYLEHDFTSIQFKINTVFASLGFPITLVGSLAILIVKFGWVGIISIAIVLLVIPLAHQISKINGKISQRINNIREDRLYLCTQIVEGIKFIKLNGWQIVFKNRLQQKRDLEITEYKWLAFGRSLQRALSNSIPYWSALITFVLAEYVTQHLSTASIFSTLEILVNVKLGLMMFIMSQGFYYELKHMLARQVRILNLENFRMVEIDGQTKKVKKRHHRHQHSEDFQINLKVRKSKRQLRQENNLLNAYSTQNLKKDEGELFEQKVKQKLKQPSQRIGVFFADFDGYWAKDLFEPTLRNINISFYGPKLYGIGGKAGSGKSGLLNAILQEVPYFSGKLLVNGKISIVEQEPLLQQNSIRSNILFGRDYIEQDYNKAIEMGCLRSDLQMMEEGDLTFISENGNNISFGQRVRIAMARAVYSNADIFLFEDPLSAVDPKVARIIFKNCIKNLSKQKTVILITHHVTYLHQCDQIVVMESGSIKYLGAPQDFKQQLKELFEYEREDQSKRNFKQSKMVRYHGVQELSQKSKTQKMTISKRDYNIVIRNQQQGNVHIHSEENVKVTSSTIIDYLFINRSSRLWVPLTVLMFFIAEGITTVFFRLLAQYDNLKKNHSNIMGNDQGKFWGLVAGFMFLFFICQTLKYFLTHYSVLVSNQKLHQEMIDKIVKSPCGYFDKTPSGHIINKFSDDLGVLDKDLAFSLVDTFEGPALSLVYLINVCQINLFFIPAAVVISVLVVLFFGYARKALIECKQLDLKYKRALFHLFNFTLNGLTQINVFERKKKILEDFIRVVNNSTKSSFAFNLISRGFSFYFVLMGLVLISIGFMVGVNQANHQTVGQYGITVVFLVQFGDFLHWFLLQIINAQSLTVSIERAFILTNLQSEKDFRTEYDKQIGLQKVVEAAEKGQYYHQNWPDKYRIEVKNLQAKYRPELPLVLNGVSFEIEEGQMVAVVGRTGSGKSSIIQSLFRIIEPGNQSIINLGPFNALKMGLHSLRQHISVIPQSPFIFRGTIKENTDPNGVQEEEDIWGALQLAGLSSFIRALPDGLQTQIQKGSSVLSAGQKQQLCLARALLRKNKIIVMDEATPNVDMNTEDQIKHLIQEKLVDTTIITIAHRLNTIADYDRVIVLHKGEVKQVGSPHELIQSKGHFYRMVQNTGKNSTKIIQKARNRFMQKGQKKL